MSSGHRSGLDKAQRELARISGRAPAGDELTPSRSNALPEQWRIRAE